MLATESLLLSTDEYFTPDRVKFWLKNWEMLRSLAETPRSSVHLVSPECRHAEHGCAGQNPVGIRSVKGLKGDPYRYSDILADLNQAADFLPPHSLESQVVARLMSGNAKNLDEVCEQIEARDSRVYGAFRCACTMMARTLGWEEAHQNV